MVLLPHPPTPTPEPCFPPSVGPEACPPRAVISVSVTMWVMEKKRGQQRPVRHPDQQHGQLSVSLLKRWPVS